MPIGAGFAASRGTPTGSLLVAGPNATAERKEIDRRNILTMPSSRLASGDYVLLVWTADQKSIQAAFDKTVRGRSPAFYQIGNLVTAKPYVAGLVKFNADSTPSVAFQNFRNGLAFALPGSATKTGSGFYSIGGTLQILQGTIQAETQRYRQQQEEKRERCGPLGICLPSLGGVKTVLLLAVILVGLIYFGPIIKRVVPAS